VSDAVAIAEALETVEVSGDSAVVTIVEETVEVVSIGIQGPAGPSGLVPEAVDKNYVAVLSGQTDVIITHGLNKYPSVTVFDSSGDEVEGDYRHIDSNNTQLLFSAGFSGKAIFN
jgi:hypothetical protein